MVDNENQWEEIDNSEDMEEQYDEQYGDDTDAPEKYSDDNSDYDYEEDDEYLDESAPKKSGNKILVLLIILLLIIAGAVFMMLPKLKSTETQTANEQSQIETPQDEVGLEITDQGQQENTQNLGDKFFEQAGGEGTDMMSVDFNNTDGQTANVTTKGENGEIVASVTPSPQQNSNPAAGDDLFAQSNNNSPAKNNDTIMVSYNPTLRTNPFKPPVISPKEDKSYELLNTTGFEIIEPPAESEADENLTLLLQTQISGILYDSESPSAIVNINGKDQFVKTGDVISGYKIQSITKDKVQISYKNNTYVASVGQLFTKGELEKKPAVANLENKFAGRYKNN